MCVWQSVVNPAETEQLSEGSAYDGGCRTEALTTPAGLAELRVSTAAKLRRMKSPLTFSSQAPIKGAAMLVVQRTSDRAQQVEVNASEKSHIQWPFAPRYWQMPTSMAHHH